MTIKNRVKAISWKWVTITITILTLQNISFSQSVIEKVDELLEQSAQKLRSSPQEALTLAEEAFNYAPDLDPERLSKVYYGMAMSLAMGNDKGKALEYAEKGLKIARENNLKNQEAVLLYPIAITHYLLGDTDMAIYSHHEGLSLASELKDDVLRARYLNGISVAYIENKEMDRAIPYLEEVLLIGEARNDLPLKGIALGNLSYAYLYKKEYTMALGYIEQSIALHIEKNDNLNLAIGYDMLAQIQNGLNQTDNALKSVEKTITIAKENNYTDGVIIGTKTKAAIYNNRKEYHKAISQAQMGMTLADSIKSDRFNIDLINELIESNINVKNYPEVLTLYKKLEVLKDSNFSIEKQKLREKLEVEYRLKEKEEENKNLLLNQKRNETIIKQSRLISTGSILLTILIIALSYSLYNSLRKNKKHSESLEIAVKNRTAELATINEALLNSNVELERFAFVASHDLKEPVRNIVSFSTLIKKSLEKKEYDSLDSHIQFISSNAKNLYALIDGILNFSRMRQVKLLITQVDLNLVLTEIRALISSTLQENNVSITSTLLPTVDCDQAQILLVFKNIIENAVKYNNSTDKSIHLSSRENAQEWIIDIKDNGLGIDPKYHEYVFGMFKRLHSKGQYEGTGLGLSICKKIMNMHHGEIQVSSAHGTGSTFSLIFKKNFKGEPFIQSEQNS